MTIATTNSNIKGALEGAVFDEAMRFIKDIADTFEGACRPVLERRNLILGEETETALTITKHKRGNGVLLTLDLPDVDLERGESIGHEAIRVSLVWLWPQNAKTFSVEFGGVKFGGTLTGKDPVVRLTRRLNECRKEAMRTAKERMAHSLQEVENRISALEIGLKAQETIQDFKISLGKQRESYLQFNCAGIRGFIQDRTLHFYGIRNTLMIETEEDWENAQAFFKSLVHFGKKGR